MMIDKNGKLFGRINVIDLLIILVIIAAGVILAVRTLGDGKSSSGAQQVRLTFYGTDVPDLVAESLSQGIPVKQYSTEIPLGTLTSFSYEPAYAYEFNSHTGEPDKLPVANRCFVTLTCEPTGSVGEWGFTAGATTFTVGGNYWLDVGASRAGYMLKSIEVLG